MKFYRIESEAGDKWITNIKDEDIVESFINNSLKTIDEDIVRKYNIKAGDRKISVNFDEIEENSSYTETYTGDYIRLDSIDKDAIYFDNYTDEFFSGSDVLSWDADEYYWYFDGSNWRMIEVLEEKDLDLELVDSEKYNTGTVEIYEDKNGNIIKVDCSMYQGSLDDVIEGEDLLEN